MGAALAAAPGRWAVYSRTAKGTGGVTSVSKWIAHRHPTLKVRSRSVRNADGVTFTVYVKAVPR